VRADEGEKARRAFQRGERDVAGISRDRSFRHMILLHHFFSARRSPREEGDGNAVYEVDFGKGIAALLEETSGSNGAKDWSSKRNYHIANRKHLSEGTLTMQRTWPYTPRGAPSPAARRKPSMGRGKKKKDRQQENREGKEGRVLST